jgi:hypothetical protein
MPAMGLLPTPRPVGRATSASVQAGGSSAEATRTSARCERAVPEMSAWMRSSARPPASTPSRTKWPSRARSSSLPTRQRALACRSAKVRMRTALPCSSPSLLTCGQRPATWPRATRLPDSAGAACPAPSAGAGAASSGASASSRGASTMTRQSSLLAPRAAIVPSSWTWLPAASTSSDGRARPSLLT